MTNFSPEAIFAIAVVIGVIGLSIDFCGTGKRLATSWACIGIGLMVIGFVVGWQADPIARHFAAPVRAEECRIVDENVAHTVFIVFRNNEEEYAVRKDGILCATFYGKNAEFNAQQFTNIKGPWMTDTSPEAIAALCERARKRRIAHKEISVDGETCDTEATDCGPINPNGPALADMLEVLAAERDKRDEIIGAVSEEVEKAEDRILELLTEKGDLRRRAEAAEKERDAFSNREEGFLATLAVAMSARNEWKARAHEQAQLVAKYIAERDEALAKRDEMVARNAVLRDPIEKLKGGDCDDRRRISSSSPGVTAGASTFGPFEIPGIRPFVKVIDDANPILVFFSGVAVGMFMAIIALIVTGVRHD